MVTARGGTGIAVRVDHTEEEEVKALFERIRAEQHGQLDLLVNDVWGGDALTGPWDRPFFEHSLANGLLMQERAVKSHLITSHYGVPLMAERRQGLVIEITDGLDYKYRGNLYYSLAKISTIHLAEAMAADLKPFGVTALAITPGFLRSEEMLTHFGVTEANWQEGAKKDPHFAQSETPYYIGKAVAALAADLNVAAKSGKVFMSGDIAEEYGFRDVDGRQPNWRAYYEKFLASQQ